MAVMSGLWHELPFTHTFVGLSPQPENAFMLFAQFRAAAVVALLLATRAGYEPGALPMVEANDNRTPAGTLKDGTLKVNLVVQMARWYPEAADGPFAEVAAFSEEGKAPQVPAPLIRVPEGTTIEATLTNALSDSTLWIRGLVTRPSAKPDSVPIRPGETKAFSFVAGAPGTYLYWATPGKVNSDSTEREQLAGAFVVDPVGARTDDRILMINIWGNYIDSAKYRNVVAINGKSWPHTERLTAEVGESVRWRVINASTRSHPMHLHGFYFTVISRGSYLADTVLAARKRLAVTEDMRSGTTMAIEFTPNRPGNWLFHCHLVFHVNSEARLDSHEEAHHHATDPMNHMAGLVMGIRVTDPLGLAVYPSGNARKLRLFANERKAGGSTGMRMSYVLQRGSRAPATDSVERPGAMLLLTRNEPTEITVVNRTHAATSVHWHGLELESYSDGVAGWSGADMKVAPMIAPNDSFTARLTHPRAGTFIYHTHLNDEEQLTSGAYGPLIVLDPGEKWNAATDHVFTLGRDRSVRPGRMVVNGDSTTSVPLELKLGRTHRFRFVNITPANRITFALRRDSLPVTWRPRAKDGADLPEAMRAAGPALRSLALGETFDAEWTPTEPGVFAMTAGGRSQWFYSRSVIVR